MNTREPQNRHPEKTQASILDAATALFVEHGVSAVSMTDIAKQSGVTKSLIHHHFGSKAELWESVKDRAFNRYLLDQRVMLEGVEEATPGLLKTSVETYFRFLKDNPDVVRLFAWAHLERDTKRSGANDALVQLGAERIRRAQKLGVFRHDVNPTHVVATFVMVCTEWFQSKSHRQQWPEIGEDEEYLEDFLTIFMEGLLPRDG